MVQCSTDGAALRTKGIVMSKRSTFATIADAINVLGSAVAAAYAAEAGHRPKARDLTNLGIEPKAFRDIRRYY
jgi:hypothetical protein